MYGICLMAKLLAGADTTVCNH